MKVEQYESLTPTERDVLRRLANGSRPGEIAAQLDRSISTVNNHLHSARAKLAVSDSASAARALLAFERHGQSVPRHDMPMVHPPVPHPLLGSQPPGAWPSTLLQEERPQTEHVPPSEAGHSWSGKGGKWHATTAGGWRRLGATLLLTLLLLACIALAPAMAETWQLLIKLIYRL